MNRRKSIRALFVGTVSTALLIEACDAPDKPLDAAVAAKPVAAEADRMPEEIIHNKEINNAHFFTAHELATVGILADIIIPRDEVSGSATDSDVPAFIDFMMNDRPENQTPMRGGLKWLDIYCLKTYQKPFVDCSAAQRIEVVDQIAYPAKTKPEFSQGSGFFSLIRNFTVTGFYTSKMGVKDLGYMGNTPNKWNGVPATVLKQYNIAYTEKELKECVSYDNA